METPIDILNQRIETLYRVKQMLSFNMKDIIADKSNIYTTESEIHKLIDEKDEEIRIFNNAIEQLTQSKELPLTYNGEEIKPAADGK